MRSVPPLFRFVNINFKQAIEWMCIKKLEYIILSPLLSITNMNYDNTLNYISKRIIELNVDDVNARDKINMRAIDYAKMLDEKFLIEVLKKKKTDEEIEAYIRSSEIKTYFSLIFDIIKTIISFGKNEF